MSLPERTRHSRLTVLAPLLAALVLSACGTTGKNAETRFYLLSPLPADTAPLAAARRQPPLAIALAPVKLPQYLERPQIVSRLTQNRLEVNEFDNWGGSLGKNMTRVLAANLSALLATPDVRITGLRQSARIDARVQVQVLRFERGPDGRSVLKAQWRILGPGRDQPPRLTRISRFVSTPIPPPAPGTATDRQGDVAALSTLLGELSATIARAIVQAGGT